jgi:hypothetical protein
MKSDFQLSVDNINIYRKDCETVIHDALAVGDDRRATYASAMMRGLDIALTFFDGTENEVRNAIRDASEILKLRSFDPALKRSQ